MRKYNFIYANQNSKAFCALIFINASLHNSVKWKPFTPDFHPTHQNTDINSFTTVSKKKNSHCVSFHEKLVKNVTTKFHKTTTDGLVAGAMS